MGALSFAYVVPTLLYAIPCFLVLLCRLLLTQVQAMLKHLPEPLIGERMVFIVYITETTVGHVFTELAHVLDYLKAGKRHHRIELWNKGEKRATHW